MSAVPRSTWLLLAAQAIYLTALVIAVTVAPVVGAGLAPTPALATVPYGIQFASVLLFTYPLAMAMRRWGRRRVFLAGALALAASGVVGALAVIDRSFAGMALSHALLGLFVASANYYRFAAGEGVEPVVRPRVVSLVVAGGVVGAVVGPLVAQGLRDVPGLAAYSAVYASLVALGIATAALVFAWRPAVIACDPGVAVPRLPPGVQPGRLGLSIFCAAGGYFVMNLLMVQASIVMKDICSFERAAQAIQVHALAMFLPSFLTPLLATRVGLERLLPSGFLLLAAAGGAVLAGTNYQAIVAGLVLLGLGWNLTYVGGSALLAQSVDDASRHRWQGVNDTFVAVCATLGAFLPAPLVVWPGWRGSNVLVALVCTCAAGWCVWIFSRRVPCGASRVAHGPQ